MTTRSAIIKIHPPLIDSLKTRNIATMCEGCDNLTDTRNLCKYEHGIICTTCKCNLVQWASNKAGKTPHASAEIITILKILRAVGVPYSRLPYIR
jgi:hypothetical protein